MNDRSRDTAAAAEETPPSLSRVLNTAVIALVALLLLWELWLAPIRVGGSWLALKAVPLALALPGLLRGARYTRQWLSLLLPFYFAEGIVRAMSEGDRVRALASAEIALSLVAFVAIMLMLRRRGKSGPR